MCNIAVLSAGVSIPYEKIFNVTNNNPHGYGLILKDKEHKKLEVIRKCHEKGNDPKEIFDLLEDNKDVERYLHVRYRTEGPIDLNNAHPFSAYNSNSRQIHFMHNGTLTDFKTKISTTYEKGVKIETVEGDQNISDSKNFNDNFLAPLLLNYSGENGRGDIHDPVFQMIIDKFWSYNSKGLLICNDLDPVFINKKDWKELDFGGGKFWSSNNDYWNTLVRGPVYEAKKKKDAEESAARASKFQARNSNNTITSLKDLNLKPKEVLTEDLARIFEDYDIWTEEGMASLCNLTEVELLQFVEKDHECAAALLIQLTSSYDTLYKNKQRLIKYIKQLKNGEKLVEDPEDEKELASA